MVVVSSFKGNACVHLDVSHCSAGRFAVHVDLLLFTTTGTGIEY